MDKQTVKKYRTKNAGPEPFSGVVAYFERLLICAAPSLASPKSRQKVKQDEHPHGLYRYTTDQYSKPLRE